MGLREISSLRGMRDDVECDTNRMRLWEISSLRGERNHVGCRALVPWVGDSIMVNARRQLL